MFELDTALHCSTPSPTGIAFAYSSLFTTEPTIDFLNFELNTVIPEEVRRLYVHDGRLISFFFVPFPLATGRLAGG
jgi:hypothetical protein